MKCFSRSVLANKQSFANEFVARTRFTSAFPLGMTAAQFVDALNANSGGALSTAERNQLVNQLTAGTMTRAQVLRAIAEDQTMAQAEFNRAFVLMQYFGYLRRNPNSLPDSDFAGYNFWLQKLNEFGGNFVDAQMASPSWLPPNTGIVSGHKSCWLSKLRVGASLRKNDPRNDTN